ncbi:MAG: serine--tRNA ligase [Candidatus Saccharimonadales bacterium]
MLDVQFVRDNPNLVQEKSKQKGYDVDVSKLLELDKQRRSQLTSIEGLRKWRNEQAIAIKGQKPTQDQLATGRQIKEDLTQLEANLKKVESNYIELLQQLPNMPLDDVPVGASEKDNVVAKHVGDKKTIDFVPKNHWDLAASKGWIDKERASKVAGSRFAYLKGDLVQLQFSIIQFTLNILRDSAFLQNLIEENKLQISAKPFEPILPPAMLKTEVFAAMDRLEPRDERYKVGEAEDDLWLQGSAEHTLGSMYKDEILDESQLPIRYVGYASSFRREAGTYGKDTEGIFRVHQFDKLEMEVFSTAETGLDEHKLLRAIQEHLVQKLGLPYQVLQKCTADIGKPNAQGTDIEVWMPGQGRYRETHTADYMTDYQTRRLGTRVKRSDGRIELVHTNDATAFALGRIMIAIIENYQTEDGSVRLPDALLPYTYGMTKL